MTLFMLFAGIGLLSYFGLAYAEAAFSGPSSAFFALVSNVVAAVVLFYGYRLLQKRSALADRASPWRTRSALAALVLCAGGVAAVIAATRRPDDARIVSPNAQAAEIDANRARSLAAGGTLFQERGCIGCHRSDGAGVGPSLHGRFGGPVEYPGSAVGVVNDAYLREAILNPSATVAAGFQPVMPTFAGRLTEEELEALVAYVTSLSARAQVEGNEVH